MYHYRAIDPQGKVVHGTIPSPDGSEAAAVAKLQARGLIPLRIQRVPFEAPGARPDAPQRKKISVWRLPWTSSRLTSRDLISIAEDIAVLLEAGISLARGLSVLMDLHAERRGVAGVLRSIHSDLREGVMFWEAMSRHPQFPPVFVNMVRAGEAGGALPTILGRLAAYLEEMHELRSFLFGAMIYPVILTLTSLVSMVLMLVLVVPKFAGIFQDMGVEIPTMTLVMFKAWHGAAGALVAHGPGALSRGCRPGFGAAQCPAGRPSGTVFCSGCLCWASMCRRSRSRGSAAPWARSWRAESLFLRPCRRSVAWSPTPS
jgi:general secretion pathway protein F